MLRSGAEAVKQTSGRARWPGFTVAKNLEVFEVLVTRGVAVDLPRKLEAMEIEGSFGTL